MQISIPGHLAENVEDRGPAQDRKQHSSSGGSSIKRKKKSTLHLKEEGESQLQMAGGFGNLKARPPVTHFLQQCHTSQANPK